METKNQKVASLFSVSVTRYRSGRLPSLSPFIPQITTRCQVFLIFDLHSNIVAIGSGVFGDVCVGEKSKTDCMDALLIADRRNGLALEGAPCG